MYIAIAQAVNAIVACLAYFKELNKTIGYPKNAPTIIIILASASATVAKTFFGLSGLGDLVLSSTDNQSRNRALGGLIGSGQSFSSSIERLGSTPEGANAIKTLVKNKIVTADQPISFSVYQVLYENLSPSEAAKVLMERPIGDEH